MSYVIWSDLYSVRVPYIDSQHKKLLEIANMFHHAMDQNSARQELFEIFNRLIHYVEVHFREEEELMEKAQYPSPEFDSHIKEHERLTDEIFSLHADFARGDSDIIPKLSDFLDNWLVKHILVTDRYYIPYCSQMAGFKPKK